MNDDLAIPGRNRRRALPGLVLALMAVAVVLASGARADDPPIVSVGPVSSNGNTASGSVGSDGKTEACVNDQHSGSDPSASDPNNAAQLNDASCQATEGSSATGASGTTSGGNRTSSATASVASANAVGLRIVRVRHFTRGVSVTKRFRVLITLRDVRGRFVRDAIVSVSRMPGARNTISGMHSTFSNRLGQARLVLPVARRMLGKRLYLKISARTPTARTLALRSVRLPRLG